MLQLDAVQTLALAGLALFLGYGLCRVVPFLARYNLPPPVVGGLVFALAAWAAHGRGPTLSSQSPMGTCIAAKARNHQPEAEAKSAAVTPRSAFSTGVSTARKAR